MTELNSLRGRTAIVTGAGGGIGKGIALALAKAGANVVISARRPDNGEPAAAEIRVRGGSALFIRTDVTCAEDIHACVTQTVEQFGGLDIMVHNALAATPRDLAVETQSLDYVRDGTATTTTATLHCAQAAFPHLQKSEAGRYILVSSTAGIRGNPVMPVYSMVKAAQRGITRALAWEWAPYGITVNVINPVAVSEAVQGLMQRDPEAENRMRSRLVLNFLGDAERDVGSTAAFVAGDGARYLTGHTFMTDGGCFFL